MRYRILVVLVATISIVIAACGGAAEVATETVDETPSTEAVAEVETTTTTAAEVESTTEAPPDTEPPSDQTTTPAPEEEETPVAEIPAGPVDGMAIYESNCARCHSNDGSGGRGSNLQGIAEEQPEITGGIEIVNNGGRGMPAFDEDLTPEEIEAVVNYVWDTF